MEKYVRCYELPDTEDTPFDRYTVVYARKGCYVTMSDNPDWPQGVCIHGEGNIDKPSSKHLGNRISLSDLPLACRKVVVRDIYEMKGLGSPNFNPGGDGAIELGCTCPILDNSHGSEYEANLRGGYWYSANCPVHCNERRSS